MSESKTSEPAHSKINPKSDVQSPTMGPDGPLKVFGGMPPDKEIAAIEKTNTPEGRGRAPGSVGF